MNPDQPKETLNQLPTPPTPKKFAYIIFVCIGITILVTAMIAYIFLPKKANDKKTAQNYTNPFVPTPTVYQNPFVSPTTTYENPFTSMDNTATDEAYQNPFSAFAQ